MPPVQPNYVIAIGASAGGLEEINSFFDHTPMDGVSYVIVQHLSSDFKSRMAELLARHSKLIILEAENEMKVKANQVYLIPNDKFMTIHNGNLYLSEKEKAHGPNLTINRFFNSLAIDIGRKAIGVILSGLGSDGTEGINSIKNAGGMVIARNPDTSEFNSMPSNAIATGRVDFIAEPSLMPGIIENYVKHDGTILSGSIDEEKKLKSILDFIKEQLPLDFTDYKQTTMLRRVKKRATDNNFIKLEDYLDFLKETPGEVEALAKDFLISVTSFFRDKEAFDFIESDVIPKILERLAPDEELKMWVAGCATGEEAYSLAMLIQEQLTGHLKDTVVKIFATDIDTVALVHARNGVYKPGIIKNVSPERLEKFFTKEGKNYKVTLEIRNMVIFSQHDLVKNPPYCNMHFISCRNLLIYMMPALQKRIFSMLLFGLKKNGYLFLGSSENPLPIIQNLKVVHKKWKIYKNLETKRAIRFDTFSLPQMVNVNESRPFALRKENLQEVRDNLTEAVNKNLISELDQLTVCIDENNRVVKTYGDTSKYLLQKNFNLNLTELLPAALALAFNTIKVKILKTNKKTTVTGIKTKNGSDIITVTLSVSPLNVKDVEQKLLMVTFSEETNAVTGQQDETIFDEKIYLDKYTKDMEEELKELRDKLHNSYEQLDRSNDNMQSFNEELLSANEEMQSTNEEMQSVNEELHTVNTDYQLKNKELQEINDDLNNYFRSNINGQLFVDSDMKLMKFSPGTVKQINLLESDIGRPLSHIATNIKLETITNDIKKVIEEGIVITKEIETNNGLWYLIMTMPYIRQADNRRSGAIITFNDITELKTAEDELSKKNKSLQRINEDLDNFVYVASHDLLAPLGNIEASIDLMNQIKLNGEDLNKISIIINTSIKKFRSLVTDMASIGKIESEMKSMEMVDLNEIIDNIEWSLNTKIALTGTVIKRNLDVTHVYFSKKNLRSILYNLISNGIKFKGDKPPVININSVNKEGNVLLSVEDNGIGLDRVNIKKVFDLYGRLHHDIEGQGIGLYLAKKIVDAAGGDITVESELGKGTRVTINFKTEPEVLPILVF